MKKSRFSEEQIIGFIKEVEAGMPVAELCRKHGFSDASFYKWHACRLVGLSRTRWRETPTTDAETQELSVRIAELAYQRRRFGYRRIHDLLRAEGRQ